MQSEYRDRIWHRKIYYADNEKRKKTTDRKNKIMTQIRKRHAMMEYMVSGQRNSSPFTTD